MKSIMHPHHGQSFHTCWSISTNHTLDLPNQPVTVTTRMTFPASRTKPAFVTVITGWGSRSKTYTPHKKTPCVVVLIEAEPMGFLGWRSSSVQNGHTWGTGTLLRSFALVARVLYSQTTDLRSFYGLISMVGGYIYIHMYNNMYIYICMHTFMYTYICATCFLSIYIYIQIKQYRTCLSPHWSSKKKNGVKGASFPGSCGAHASGRLRSQVVKGRTNGILPMR